MIQGQVNVWEPEGKAGEAPRSWTLRLAGGERIVVHRYILVPGAWFLSVYQVGIDRRMLKATTERAAKVEALAVLSARFATLHHQIVEAAARLGAEEPDALVPADDDLDADTDPGTR